MQDDLAVEANAIEYQDEATVSDPPFETDVSDIGEMNAMDADIGDGSMENAVDAMGSDLPTSDSADLNMYDSGMDPTFQGDPYSDWLYSLTSLLPIILTVLLLAGIVYGARRVRRRRREMRLAPSGDTMRYALASAALRGTLFRRKVIDDAQHICRARPPEIGLDRQLFIRACEYYEAQNVAVSWLTVFASLIAVVSLPFFWAPIIVAMVHQWIERFSRTAPYRKENFSLEEERKKFGVVADDVDQNIVCYGSTNPFVGLGEWLNSWSVPIDTTKRRPGRSEPPDKVTAEELYDVLEQSITRLSMAGTSSRDVLFVSGTEVGEFPDFLPDRHSRPREVASGEMIARLKSASNFRARVYRWITVSDWDGDLVYSYLYRCERRGEALFFEATQLALAPVSADFREIDDLPRTNFRVAIGWPLVALITSPIIVIRSFLTAYMSLSSAWNHIFESEGRRQRREVNESQAYNYGAQDSIRSKMATAQSYIYFQIIDQSLIAQILNQQILKSLIQFLEERGIDTSVIETQALTVINNSTFVNKGSIVSQSSVTGTIAGAGSKIGSAQPSPAEKAA